MKKPLLLLVYLLPVWLFGQVTVDTTIRLDLLKSPASPAFNILGIAPSIIERPTDLSSFSLSLQQATNNFTTIPNSYAIQVAPFLLSRQKFTLNTFDSNRYTFRQSLNLSLGFTHQGPAGQENTDSLKTTKLGFGLQFSIIRPRWSNQTRAIYRQLQMAQTDLLTEYRNYEQLQDSLFSKRAQLRALGKKENKTPTDDSAMLVLVKAINLLEEDINEAINAKLANASPAYELARRAAVALKNERKGGFLDFSGGFALDFPDDRFNRSQIYRGGAWLTGGYEGGNNGLTAMGIVRYLYNPESLFATPDNRLLTANLSTLDAGARFLYNTDQGRFMFSGEALYRSILNQSVIAASWRLVLNASYDIGMNRKLTFSFGKDFDGTISKGGNLVSALNLILGFGSERASGGAQP